MAFLKSMATNHKNSFYHEALSWSLYDIKAHALQFGHHPNKEQAQKVLSEFFDDRGDHIIEYINNLMADYLNDFYNGYDND